MLIYTMLYNYDKYRFKFQAMHSKKCQSKVEDLIISVPKYGSNLILCHYVLVVYISNFLMYYIDIKVHKVAQYIVTCQKLGLPQFTLVEFHQFNEIDVHLECTRASKLTFTKGISIIMVSYSRWIGIKIHAYSFFSI